MKKDNNIIYFCSMILFAFIIGILININKFSFFVRQLSIIGILFLLIFVLILNFSLKKDKNYIKPVVLRSVIAFLMFYLVVLYGLGVILGFSKSYLSLDLKTELLTILPIVLVMASTELLKKIVFSRCFKDTKIIVIYTTLIATLLILYDINITSIQSPFDIFIFVCTVLLPVVVQEALCSYITYKVSWIPSLVFKLVISLYVYIIPIVPNLGDYLNSILNILLPFLIYFDINKSIIKYEKVKEKIKKTNTRIFSITLLIFLIIVILLTSGIFKYKVVAIASNSMKPVFSRGDVIIYEKIDVKDLNVDDIIAFRKDNIIITHRITKIWKRENLYYYVTKGDANNDVDFYNPTSDDVLGKITGKFKYLGYPTVFISELLRKE